MNIIEKKEYPLLSRTEITAEESYTGATPSRETIKKILADKLNARNELIVIKHIYPEFGFGNARIIAHLYSNKKDMERIEPEYAFNKGILREKKEEKKQDKPKADEKKINDKFEQEEKAVENLGGDINNVLKIMKEKSNKKSSKVYIYVLPNELSLYKNSSDLIKKKTGLDVEIFAVNDKNKYDPENKSGKAKPGKPAIYLN